MTKYRNNHYVPVWYQERFIPTDRKERKFFYLDLKPERLTSNGRSYTRNSVMRWGPKSCFCAQDLYTTKFGAEISTEIEEKFFGRIDESAPAALDYFESFAHPSVDGDALHTFVPYMSIQKLRTPKGLAYLSKLFSNADRNQILFHLQRLQHLYCALWTECVWTIADASESSTKFLLSDHPVTVYNEALFPASTECRGCGDPEIWLNGTHTLFPLSLNKLLILTNLSWVRYPYGNPTETRPHPNMMRPAMFKFTDIHTNRRLSNEDVIKINYIIKMRATRYVAAVDRSWLYPEEFLRDRTWNRLSDGYLFMPDPRSVIFSSEIIMGFKDGGSDSFDEYGRKPWHGDYNDQARMEFEWETFHAFQGEYARLHGPTRRTRSFEMGRLSPEIDNDDYHRYHLRLEQKFKKHRYRPR